MSEVAAGNPHAWTPRFHSVAEIALVSRKNRWISWPYPKLMNANNSVEQSAALLVCSAAAAERAGVPRDRWIFPWAAAEADDTYALAERPALHRSPAIRVAGQRVFELGGVGIDDVGLIDIYSCFPSAVQVAAAELGVPIDDPDRPLTLTGGLTFAGGPWNNYVSHSLAAMVTVLREKPGLALITANGGYLTKHSIGLYGSAPPRAGFRWADVQSEVDSESTTPAHDIWKGLGVLEAWTMLHDRDGERQAGFLAVGTPDGGRTLAVTRAPDELRTLVEDDPAGAAVHVCEDGTARLDERRSKKSRHADNKPTVIR